MTNEEIIESMSLPEMQEAILIGREDERSRYFPALVGYDRALGIYKYDYDLLAECFGKGFAKNCGDDYDSLPHEKQSEYFTEGAEWVDFNILRALPYYGEHAPEILFNDYDEDMEE